MVERPLALSTIQRDVVIDAARSVSPEWRRRFLASVEDRLTGLDPITDDDVQDAIRQSRARMMDTEEA